MQRGFELVPIDSGDGGLLYTVQFFTEDCWEYKKFCHRSNVEGTEAFKDMEVTLDRMIDKRGFAEHFFKTDDYEPPECAYHKDRLRMYCLRYSSSVLIAGGGGYKPKEIDGETVTSLQDVDYLNDAFENIQYVRSRISDRLALTRSLPPEAKENCLQLTDERFVGPDEAFVFNPSQT